MRGDWGGARAAPQGPGKSWLRIASGLGTELLLNWYWIFLYTRAERIKFCLLQSRRWKSSQVGEKSLQAGKRSYRSGNSVGRLGEKASGCGAETRFEKQHQMSEVSLIIAPNFQRCYHLVLFFSCFRNTATKSNSQFSKPFKRTRTSCSASSSQPTTNHRVRNKRSGQASTKSRAPVRPGQDCHTNFFFLPWRGK